MKRWLRWIPFVAALLCALPAQAGDDGKIAAAARKVRALAERLQAALDPDQCRSVTSCRVTMAAGMLDDGTLVVASSELGRRRLRSPLDAIRREVGAEHADQEEGHAEEKILDFSCQLSLLPESKGPRRGCRTANLHDMRAEDPGGGGEAGEFVRERKEVLT